MLHRVHSLCLALLLCGYTSGAQTLAHPGWRGNGIASEAWWKHAAFVRFNTDTTFAQAAETMNTMSEAGADSLILPDLLPTGPALPDADTVTHPFAAQFGTEDDLDTLLREASARRMHVLLRADLLRLAGSPGELRFWMSRGIAGFDVGEVTLGQVDTLRLLRGAMDRFPGHRILLAHLPESSPSARGIRDPVTLHLLSAQESWSHAGVLQNAVEIHIAGDLQTSLPPNTVLVLDCGLLASEETRENILRAVAAQGRHTRPHSAGRSRRRRSR